MKHVVKDGRPGFYMIYNEVLDEYGATIGPLGIAVYNVLCRFASNDGTSFPSLQTIAQKAGMSRPAVKKYLKVLKDNKLIDIEARTTEAGDSDSNWYTIRNTVARGVGNVITHVGNDVTHGREPDYPQVGNDVTPNNTYLNNTQLPTPKPARNGGSADKKTDAKARGAVHRCWQENMSGTMTPIIAEQINDLVDDFGAEAVIRAITVAVNANARTMRFVKGVLNKEQTDAARSNGHKAVKVQRVEGEDW